MDVKEYHTECSQCQTPGTIVYYIEEDDEIVLCDIENVCDCGWRWEDVEQQYGLDVRRAAG